MGTGNQTVTVTIQDKEYTIRGADDSERMLEVAAYVDKKLRQISDSTRGSNEERTAIMAALDIAGDYFQLIKEKEDLLREINNRAQRLILNVTTVLP